MFTIHTVIQQRQILESRRPSNKSMDEKEQYRIVILTYFVSTALTLLIDYVARSSPLIDSFTSAIKTTTVITLWWSFYFYFGWRLPYLRRLLYRMNYNGTWFGTYQSVSDSQEQYSGSIALRIRQSWLSISIISMTDKFENFSYSELAKFEQKSNRHGLSYTYSQRENNLFDTAQRNGTAELTLKIIDSQYCLEGAFWTIHGTNGELSVKRITKKQIDTFSEACKLAA